MSTAAPFAEPTPPRLDDPEHLPPGELPVPEPSLGGVDVTGCVLRGGSLANADLAHSTWRGVAVTRVRLTGVRLSAARLTDVLFSECQLDLSALTEARLERVALRDCRLAGADLQDLVARDVSFIDCDLSETDLTGAGFTRTVMFGCTLDGARDLGRLQGVGMRWSDVMGAAGTFATALGIRVVQ